MGAPARSSGNGTKRRFAQQTTAFCPPDCIIRQGGSVLRAAKGAVWAESRYRVAMCLPLPDFCAAKRRQKRRFPLGKAEAFATWDTPAAGNGVPFSARREMPSSSAMQSGGKCLLPRKCAGERRSFPAKRLGRESSFPSGDVLPCEPFINRCLRRVYRSVPQARRRQPNLPAMYSAVRGSLGLAKRSFAGPNSTSSPDRKKAVLSEMRAACCML